MRVHDADLPKTPAQIVDPNMAAPPTPPPMTTMTTELSAQVVIVGAGPGGLVAAALFARAGASVLVLEAHADFLRDFRGDTVHPSTLSLFSELGWLEELLLLPHDRADTISATFSEVLPQAPTLTLADFSRLKGAVPCPYVAMMPQDTFLSFVDSKASAYGAERYRLVRRARVTGLLWEHEGDEGGGDGGAPSPSSSSGPATAAAAATTPTSSSGRGRVIGVRARLGDGEQLIARASALVVAADGRRSAARAAALLPPALFPGGSPPVDVLWFKLPRDDARDPPGRSQGFVSRGNFLVSIFRGSYYQMGLLIGKGGAERMRAEGLAAFARRVAAAVPYLSAERIEAALTRFFGGGKEEGNEAGGGESGGGGSGGGRDVHVLDVRVDRLTRWWRPGFVCIGDAAHAMSPVGGVGINLAVQDAVALANALAAKVAAGGQAFRAADADLAAVQRRRELPTRATQALQVLVQRKVIGRVLGLGTAGASAAPGASATPLRPPLPLRLIDRFPALRWLPARLIGVGFRPEHIRSPEAAAS